MGIQTAIRIFPGRKKKPVVLRLVPDRSQRIRRVAQGLFVALNFWIGVQFYVWVRSFEVATPIRAVSRLAGVEGWLTIAGLMNLKYLLLTGRVPAIHPAAMFLLIAFVVMSLLLKKAFCSWLCPVETLSEYLAQIGRRVFGRSLRLPRWADLPLRGFKYLLLAFFISFIGAMSAATLAGFMFTPYGLVADVKMLNFFRQMSLTAALVLLVLVLASTLVQHFWCRYLCPYGALLGLVSLLSPVKIRRDAELASTAESVCARVPRPCRSTASCRFAPLSARPACSVSQPVRSRMLSSSLSRRAARHRVSTSRQPSGTSQPTRHGARADLAQPRASPGRRPAGRGCAPDCRQGRSGV